jgi:hypothetical protein
MNQSLNYISTILFALAITHSFLSKPILELAHTFPKYKKTWHLLGEVEIVFGLWGLVFLIVSLGNIGFNNTLEFLNQLSFVEPLFVFVVMVIAASNPILNFITSLISKITLLFKKNQSVIFYGLILSAIPLFGSLITEPAAMTLAALLLKEHFYSKNISTPLMYATLAVLFVNISIGGLLTPYAAPPVLMVANKWGWDLSFMLLTFGWKSVLVVFFNTYVLTQIFNDEIKSVKVNLTKIASTPIPFYVIAIHLAFLIATVYFSHHAAIFFGVFLLFLAYVLIHKEHQNKLIIKEGLLVASFLAGIVVLGQGQVWWLTKVVGDFGVDATFYSTALLTPFVDNAALTYLGSLLPDVHYDYQYALVAGAMAAGGLTVIANAPNPAGYSILSKYFKKEAFNPLVFFGYAVAPTIFAMFIFRVFASIDA